MESQDGDESQWAGWSQFRPEGSAPTSVPELPWSVAEDKLLIVGLLRFGGGAAGVDRTAGRAGFAMPGAPRALRSHDSDKSRLSSFTFPGLAP